LGQERGPLSLVEYNWGATWKKKVAVLVYNTGNTAVGDSSHWPRGTLYPQKLALTSPTSGGRLVGIVRSRTQTTELVCFYRFRWLIARSDYVSPRSTYFIACDLPVWDRLFPRRGRKCIYGIDIGIDPLFVI
jgi:hypothetical protein